MKDVQTHLYRLEAEAVHIMREVVAKVENTVMLLIHESRNMSEVTEKIIIVLEHAPTALSEEMSQNEILSGPV